MLADPMNNNRREIDIDDKNQESRSAIEIVSQVICIRTEITHCDTRFLTVE